MRLFIAILPDENVREALVEAQEDLKRAGIAGKYMTAGNLHLTLAFIGEYPDGEEVLDTMKTVPFTPFQIRLCGIGRFRESILWAGTEHSAALETYVDGLRCALAAAGIPFDDKPYRPHITLVRHAVLDELPDCTARNVSMQVTEISLMRSDMGPEGMVYTRIGMTGA